MKIMWNMNIARARLVSKFAMLDVTPLDCTSISRMFYSGMGWLVISLPSPFIIHIQHDTPSILTTMIINAPRQCRPSPILLPLYLCHTHSHLQSTLTLTSGSLGPTICYVLTALALILPLRRLLPSLLHRSSNLLAQFLQVLLGINRAERLNGHVTRQSSSTSRAAAAAALRWRSRS